MPVLCSDIFDDTLPEVEAADRAREAKRRALIEQIRTQPEPLIISAVLVVTGLTQLDLSRMSYSQLERIARLLGIGRQQ